MEVKQGLRPRLMAFPEQTTVSCTNSTELQWIIPKRRENEVASLKIYKLTQQTSTWQENAEEMTTTNQAFWSSVSGGRSGNCWYAGITGPAILFLKERFVPDASTQFSFWAKIRLYHSPFTIAVSTNDWATSETIYSLSSNNLNEHNFSKHTISLGAYAGKTIQLRFLLESGGYYNNGGIWIDDLSMSSGTWHNWELFKTDNQLLLPALFGHN